MSDALIMAGGKSSRMRMSSNDMTHKALVKVFEIPLIELNILYAYQFGFKTIWIAVSESEPELIDHVRQLQILYQNRLALKLEIIIEDFPLGTIGAVQFVDCKDGDLLILNVDNVLNLDLRDFMNAHKVAQADMTIATHEEPFKIPFGEIIVKQGNVIDYLEKPIKQILVSSGTYILGNSAIRILKDRYVMKRIDIPELCNILIKSESTVNSFHHRVIWTDVNDKDALQTINQMKKWPLIETIAQLRNQLINS